MALLFDEHASNMTYLPWLLFGAAVLSSVTVAEQFEATIVTILVRNGTLPFDLNIAGASIDIGLEKARKMLEEHNIQLNYVYRDGGKTCDPALIGGIAAEMYYTLNVSVFIGPGCSFQLQHIGKLCLCIYHT